MKKIHYGSISKAFSLNDWWLRGRKNEQGNINKLYKGMNGLKEQFMLYLLLED